MSPTGNVLRSARPVAAPHRHDEIQNIIVTANLAPGVAATSISYNSVAGFFTSVVTNMGTVPTPAGVYVGNGFYVDGNFVSRGSIMGPLAPGASVTINSSGGSAYTIPAGTHTITVIANDYGCCGCFQ
jgi:hypothetical protein